MPRTYVVKAGDHIPKLAAANGFGDHLAIWNDGDNQELAEQSRTPCVLNPGDTVTIPDLASTPLSRSTGSKYKFVVKRPLVHLRLAFKDASDHPLAAGTTCELKCETASFALSLDGAGRFDQEIPIKSENCVVVLPDQEMSVLVGHLAPPSEISGWRQRLNNLGYNAGTPADADSGDDDGAGDSAADSDGAGHGDDTSVDPQLASAIEEFQCNNGLPVKGQRDSTTQAKLVEIHGS